MTDKESIRSAWLNLNAKKSAEPQWGKAAQKLRNLPVYREAATVFATPDISLHQARINSLTDGKHLVMPGPSIREGFYLLPARSIPFKYLSAAVTYKGLAQMGRLLKNDDIAELSVSLLLTGSLVIDNEGGRIGDGKGFFDLCCALLQELGGLQPGWSALTFIREDHISPGPLPQDKWDTKMAGAITQTGLQTFVQATPQKPEIFWDILTLDRIKRIDPLWKLYSTGREKQKTPRKDFEI